MNREILFRAKRADTGEWIEGLPSYCSTDGNMTKFEKYLPDRFEMATIDPETICQYTGLTDKNGGKIFENDIVRGKMHGTYGYRIYTGAVEYYRDSFKVNISPESEYGDYKNIPDNCEVRGNIFDNRELLKKSNEYRRR